MADRIDLEAAAIGKAADILVAYLSQNAVEPAALPALVRDVRLALSSGFYSADPVRHEASLKIQPLSAAPSTVADREHAVGARAAEAGHLPSPDQIAASILPDYLISFEDGRQYRSLRRHLMAKHGLTPEQYRVRWGLPSDYPMVAPSYAQERSEVAKRIGLGRNKSADRPVRTSVLRRSR